MRKNGHNPFHLTAGLAIAALVSLVAAACNGDGSSDETPSPTPDTFLLDQMVLTEQDLPPWMQQASTTFTSNEDAAAGHENPNSRLEEYQAWGRLLGYTATFIPVQEGGPVDMSLGVEAEVNLYDSPTGARLGYEDLADQAMADVEALKTAESPVVQLVDLRIDEIEGESIAVQRYWVRTSGFLPDDETTMRVDNQVIFVTDRVQAFLRADGVFFGDDDRTAFTEETRAWAELMTQRIEDVLAGAGDE